MIVDNADDASLFTHLTANHLDNNKSSQAVSAEVVLEFLPQSQNGAILVTSRSRDVAYIITGDTNDIITVNPMDESLAIDLLQKKLQDKFAEEDAKKLVEALDYMPLAVSQAAAYIVQRVPHTSMSKYLQDLKKSDSDRIKLLNKHISDSRRDGKASNAIIATWQISFESIRRERPSAARLLSLLCLFDRQGIPKSILHGRYIEEGQEGDFEEDIYTLCSYSLVGSNVDGTELEMHRLVQFSTRTWLEMRGALENWREKLILIMDEEFPLGRYENWAVCQSLYPHVEGILGHQPTNREYLLRWASIIFNVGWFANEQGNYTLAERLNKQAVDVFKKEYGAENSWALSSMNNLAHTYRNQGRWKEAEELEVQVKDTRKRVLGEEHPSTLTSMANLASTFWNQGRWKEAEELEVQVKDTSLRVLGEEHPDTLTSMANLASTYRNQGR
jgi:tetratricopeptide (TPR) repeat protein